jgi:TRAP-type C4-dicarboxylate transport system permease small subunit
LNKYINTIWRFLVNLIEIYIPVLSFFAMFLAFILQIFTRYVLGAQVPWTYEVTIIGFMWVVALGGAYASRLREHVSFTMLYDKMSISGKALTEIISNVILIIAFVIMFFPVLEFIDFMKIKKTAVMKIPISILYAPFIFFIISSTSYIIRDTISAVKVLINHQKIKDKK